MRVLLLDSSALLDPTTIRQLAAKAGLAPRVLHQPLDARALSDTLDAPVEYAGLLLYGETLNAEQLQELDALLEDLDTPLDLVLELAGDPRPLEQRLAGPLGGDSPSAAHYRRRGLWQRVWVDADKGAVAAAVGYRLADAVRARHPERESVFPPEVAPRVKPDAPAEAKVRDEATVRSRPAAPSAEQEGDAATGWRRSAEQKGRIKRRSPAAGGRAGRGWRPKS